MNKTTLNSQKEKHSMLSLRRATSLGLLSLKPHTHFYPRSPCGERPGQNPAAYKPDCNFYPRSPCGERLGKSAAVHPNKVDFYPRSPCGERPPATTPRGAPGEFLSTLSLRRATEEISHNIVSNIISIHALLAESDRSTLKLALRSSYFYPRSPCGERLKVAAKVDNPMPISIHALLAESDCVRRSFIQSS